MGEQINFREVGIDHALNTFKFYDHLALSADYAGGSEHFLTEVFAAELKGLSTEDLRYLGWLCTKQAEARERFGEAITAELQDRWA